MRRTTFFIIFFAYLLLSIHSGLAFAETSRNLYSDAKYKFRIIFPYAWVVTKGYGQADIAVQAVEKDNGSNITIIVKNLPQNYTADMLSEKEMSDFIEGVKNKSPDAVLLYSGVTQISSKKALVLKHSESYKFLGINVQMIVLTFMTVDNEKLFIINCATLPDLYNELEKTFIETVSTFAFGK
jgi:hypothetical protein